MTQTGVVEITIELQATPDVLTHVARLTETVLAVDGIMTVRRAPTLYTGNTGEDATEAMQRAMTGEHPVVQPDDVEPPRRGRRG